MAARIEVKTKIKDTRAAALLARLRNLGFRKLTGLDMADVYAVDARISPARLRSAAALLANPLTETFAINAPLAPARFAFAAEIGFLPGVTDNVGATARETIADFLRKKFRVGEAVYTAQIFYFSGRLDAAEAERLAAALYNPLIQHARVKSLAQFKRDGGMGLSLPKVRLAGRARADEVNLWLVDEELVELGARGIPNPDGSRRGPMALDLESLQTIRSYFHKLRRNPTDVELETLAQTWSEHCKHTIFADPMDDINEGIFRRYIRGATEKVRQAKGKNDFCVSVFKDNSGAIDFDGEYLLTHKVETHNSPSALDPFGGAITGIVGVNRDTLGFGLGAKPVANTYGFCFADPADKTELYRDKEKSQPMLSARRILEGVVAGVNSGGNQSGIPTPQGFVCFDPRFRSKPLVFVGTVGLIPRRQAKGGEGRFLHEKKARVGDYIVMAGGRVGLDGIHGATFSSVALDKGSPATAVQIGDPITQKKMSDVLIKEARAAGLYTSITDNGAGGLSSSVGEMAKESNGCEVDLAKVPVKYPGLAPWQIWISESQERMTLSVPPAKWSEFEKLLRRRGVEATRIGRFTASGRCVVKYRQRTVLDLPLDFLHEGRPIKFLRSAAPAGGHLEFAYPAKTDFNQATLALLARPNLASFEFISRQYDHEVQAGSVVKPLQGRGRVNGDAAIFRPRLDSPRGAVLSQGIYPWYSDLDAYAMAAAAIDTAFRNAIVSGADPEKIALLDNFCWSNSRDPRRLHELKRAAQACFDLAVAYGAPFISGKDSMWNDFKGFDSKGDAVKISVPPTLLISALGLIPDVRRAVTLDLKMPGDYVYLLGETKEEMGASEYAALVGSAGGSAPKVSAGKNMALYRALAAAITEGVIASALSVNRGGLGVALVRAALAGELGVTVSLKGITGRRLRPEAALWSESQGRVLVSVSPKKAARFEKLFAGIPHARLGKVEASDILRVGDAGGATVVKLPLAALARAYRSTFKGF